MDGAFACPECGCEIRLVGLSPGRRVPCDWCRSLVEVPYIPRADQIKRMRRVRSWRRGRRWTRVWIGAGVAALVVVVTIVGATRAVRGRWRSTRAESLAKLVESSRHSEEGGRLGEALATLEGAVALAERTEPVPPDLAELRGRRARLARREAEAQISALERVTGDDPGRSVGQALTLAARVEKDPALAGLDERVGTLLERLRLRWVEADSAAARAAESEGRPDRALELAGRQYLNADALPTAARARWRADADALARRLIARHGTVLESARGQYTLGSARSYDSEFHPLLAAALRGAGYLPRPTSTPWSDLWESLAPFRLSIDVTERQDDSYLSSPNRLTRLDARFVLARGGEQVWFSRPFVKTTVPLPGLSAYQASRLAVGNRRSPEFERLLYDNARANLAERVASFVRGLPSFRPAVVDATGESNGSG